MKSIKPGRGPSAMNAMGSVVAVVFGVIWTAMAAAMGAPFFFPLFGVVFIIMGIVQAVYHFKNATGKDRFSQWDITENGEESDPLNDYFGQQQEPTESKTGDGFCPYCGAAVEGGYRFCPKCGRELP